MVLGSGIRDPGSGIRKKPIPDPGSRIQGSKSTQSRIRIRNTGYSQRVEVFAGFFKKDRFFLKKIDSFKESDRTFSFIKHTL